MMREYDFRVAGFLFKLHLPEEQDIDRLLPSFRPFRCVTDIQGRAIFNFVAVSSSLSEKGIIRVLEETESDLGHIRLLEMAEGYRVELRYTAGSPVHVLHAEPFFTLAMANIRWDDPYAGEVLCSLLRIVYSQAILFWGGISVHASAVAWRGKAYLFMGKSGTGKSTHAVQWLKCFPKSELLNDDNPTIRMESGRSIAYGTPWSGKTPCYENRCFPVGGIVRLRQADANRFVLQKDVDAFITLLPGCSAIRLHSYLCNGLYDTLAETVSAVPVGELDCLPDEGAALLCEESLTKEYEYLYNH